MGTPNEREEESFELNSDEQEITRLALLIFISNSKSIEHLDPAIKKDTAQAINLYIRLSRSKYGDPKILNVIVR